MHSIKPLRQLVAPLVEAEGVVVGNVIAAPHERIHRTERIALGSRQDGKAVIEISGGRTGDVPANRISDVELRRRRRKLHGRIPHGGTHSSFPSIARATSASLRVFEMAGRRPSTA